MHLPGRDDEAVVVRVSELQPGFPAAQELRSGDCIAAINGKVFAEEMVPVQVVSNGGGEDTFIVSSLNRERQDEAKKMFQARIRAIWPGSVVTFTVLRDNKVLEIPVQLAAMPAINRDSLSSLVEIRNQLMATFVESLPTGEDLHAAHDSDTPAKPSAKVDFNPPQDVQVVAPMGKMPLPFDPQGPRGSFEFFKSPSK